MITELGYKIFFQFGTINIIGMGIFSLYAVLYEPHLLLCTDTLLDRIIPETKGRSLEDMDIIFGSISAAERKANIEKQEKSESHCLFKRNLHLILTYLVPAQNHGQPAKESSEKYVEYTVDSV